MDVWTLTEYPHRPKAGTDLPNPVPAKLEATGGTFGIQLHTLRGGTSAGMDYLTIDTGSLVAGILPGRGMGLWKCWYGQREFGWQSPVRGPVHPSLVPIEDASGLGWLEGFDELLVRCGLLSNGAPEFDSQGRVRYPVHGRIANLPAYSLRIESDRERGTLDVIGNIRESRFLIYTLELESRYRFRAGSHIVEVTDTVTNPLGSAGSMQLLYHINLGQPVLQSGSRIHLAYDCLAPRDQRAAEGIDLWDVCSGPEVGYQEQVYFVSPRADEHHWSEASIINNDSTLGYSVQFDVRTLPYLNLWKNTAAVEDGYVLGIEPATGFPNARSFEEKQGRVIKLQGGESRSFRLRLEPLTSPLAVNESIARIQRLQSRQGVISAQPKTGWSASAP